MWEAEKTQKMTELILCIQGGVIYRSWPLNQERHEALGIR